MNTLWYYPNVFSRHLTEQHLRIWKSRGCFRFSRSPRSIWTPPRILSIIPTWCTLRRPVCCLLWRHQARNMSAFLTSHFSTLCTQLYSLPHSTQIERRGDGDTRVVRCFRRCYCYTGYTSIRRHQGWLFLTTFLLIWWRFWILFFKTKVQVRSEVRYHGFLRTIYTIWTVGWLSLYGLEYQKVHLRIVFF